MYILRVQGPSILERFQEYIGRFRRGEPAPALLYTGSKLEALCRSRSGADVLPRAWRNVMAEGLSDVQSFALFGASPYGSAQAEIAVGRIMSASVQKGQWAGVRIGDAYAFNAVTGSRPPEHNLLRGVHAGLTKGLCDVHYDEGSNSTYLLPNDGMLTFVNERLQQR